MTSNEVIKLIESDGWYLVATKGSHRQYKHPEKKRPRNCAASEKRLAAGNVEKHSQASGIGLAEGNGGRKSAVPKLTANKGNLTHSPNHQNT